MSVIAAAGGIRIPDWPAMSPMVDVRRMEPWLVIALEREAIAALLSDEQRIGVFRSAHGNRRG